MYCVQQNRVLSTLDFKLWTLDLDMDFDLDCDNNMVMMSRHVCLGCCF